MQRVEPDQLSFYDFDTQAELNAFILGVDEAYGFEDYKQLDSLEDALAYMQGPPDAEPVQPAEEEPVEPPEWAKHIEDLDSTDVRFDEPFDIPVGDDGLWSSDDCPSSFRATGLAINYCSDTYDHGELHVNFNPLLWDVRVHGLVYTDSTAEQGIRDMLQELGIDGEVAYSEQGMQGEDYISLDTNGEFLASYVEFLKKRK